VPVDPRIETLIPHAGSMCLLERILDWSADSIRCATSTHRDPANPLATMRGLRAVHLCEYGAQAMAVHGGLCARQEGRAVVPGLLVSLRDVTLDVVDVAALDGELVVAAERLQASDEAWQYRFEVRHDGRAIARGRATVAVRRT
jgi:Predicted 3-hydroxylacyl-(acyl carrier protein) dehydratase